MVLLQREEKVYNYLLVEVFGILSLCVNKILHKSLSCVCARVCVTAEVKCYRL